ncbi:MAG TPA: CehA/McbA family metallohydrolase, partial [Pirellulales bacterium]|nr:CehA/McbA family metallohydrolase [Pirellulales bacterium]
PAGSSITIVRRAYVAADLNELMQLAGAISEKGSQPTAQQTTQRCTLKVVDTADKPIAGAYVEIKSGGKLIVAGKCRADGTLAALLPSGVKAAEASVSSPAHGSQTVDVTAGGSRRVQLPASGTVVAAITDRAGGPIPCKVQFRGSGETKDPYFFEKSGEHAIGNLYYSHNGKFQLDLPPGKYDCTLSHGPEYDIVELPIEVLSGSQTPLAAALVRSVNTAGWISADFHNHASPSGDNVSSQYGRVLNLLCEHVEFAPCTEHNRISSYAPHLRRMGVEALMATCTGIELTSTPLPLGHLNAFPLHLHEHTQDNGAPLPDSDLEAQAARLALWDERSDKIVQQNHPDIGWLMFDKNGDGTPDSGYAGVLPHLDIIEVLAPQNIFNPPTVASAKAGVQNNSVFNWLQILNQGVRLPGVVNTDAHYNIHGSGWLRNWIACPTDDPAKIGVLDIVHAAEHGHMVMSTGPFLEVGAMADQAPARSRSIPGDDMHAPGGKAQLSVRVQCPNWLAIDRVQVFINGRPDPRLNFTRAKHPEAFAAGTVQFEREIPLKLERDAHVIVATIGEQSRLGHVMGPEHESIRAAAVSNPIYIDVDGGGFTPNKDTLGAPLPVKASNAK